MAQLIQIFDRPIADPRSGMEYQARVMGTRREDGTWEGWFEFLPLDGTASVRTERETTQPDRTALMYWASGIEAVYLDGALKRAREAARGESRAGGLRPDDTRGW